MKRLISRLHNWWNPPCPKHPDHRMNEVDVELVTGCAMMDRMCSICFKEFEETYGPF